jgi:hypothetical protein
MDAVQDCMQVHLITRESHPNHPHNGLKFYWCVMGDVNFSAAPLRHSTGGSSSHGTFTKWRFAFSKPPRKASFPSGLAISRDN